MLNVLGKRIAEKLEVHSPYLSMDWLCIGLVKSGRMEAAVDVLQIAFHSSDFLQLVSFLFADSRPCTELEPYVKPFV